ncbi:MAG: TonB-dependent receptor, partial [Sphingopyxis sp.]|nr:TonB-dependent receptor [Sphingopyxis sp.]
DFCRIANATFDCALPGTDGSANALLAPAGTALPVTPKFKGNIVARYEFPLMGNDGHFQLAANHVGKRRSDLRTEQNGIKGQFASYSTVDMSFGITAESWRAEIFATNLFDSNGVINSGVQCVETVCGDAGGDTATGGVFYDTVIRPRLIGIKVSKDF